MGSGIFAGVSGVRANQARLDVIANNIANINTIAFKGGDMRFKALFAQTINGGSAPSGSVGGTNPQQIGSGVAVGEISRNFNQGGTQFTGRTTDLQINGNGFFAVQQPSGTGNYLTRAGNFSLDSAGNLVSDAGLPVRGTSQTSGTSTTTTTNVFVPTEMQVAKDLDAGGNILESHIGGTSAVTADFTAVANAGMVTQSIETVKLVSFGVSNSGAITATYSNGDRLTVRTDANTTTTVPTTERLELIHLPAEGGTMGPDNSGPANTGPDGSTSQASDVGLFTQLGGANAVFASTGGINPMQGMHLSLQTVAVTNPLGLLYEGGNNYTTGSNTGDSFYGIPAKENRGSVQSGSLETSNVDLAEEFTNMVLSQRAIEASSRVIATNSQVQQFFINQLQ